MNFGDVVLVHFPYTSQVLRKQRPAVVVSSAAYNNSRPDVILMAITSQLRDVLLVGDVWLRDWKQAGLVKPSALKPSLATFENSEVTRHLGHLSSVDEMSVRLALRAILY